ncbi:hypothetical protein [Pseudomonas fluorescens]|uniref:Uncharacterized protein n=1 Tax=Pseudomonas fluorescens TaxID=294 RepID=A0A5E7QBM7_PSEFL|nr:hypothetical protein [Pseudomonas fluorescens]VVP59642.1 hypothetical protein PS880_06052 [Pseudomonas fluorescens]
MFNARVTTSDLLRLKIPAPSIEVLEEIHSLEGSTLTSSIERATTGDAQSIAYLQGIFFSVLPVVTDRLATAKLSPPSIPLLVAIGRAEGPLFAKALKRWVDSGCPENDDGEYLRRTYAKALHVDFNRAAGRELDEAANDVSNGAVDVGTAVGQPDEPLKQQSGKNYVNRHVYGGKVAVCFSADQTRTEEHTIRIEAAMASGTRTYNWEDKIAIQLSTRELPSVLATLLQIQSKFEGKGHGAQNEKWFVLENQPGKVYLSVNAKGATSRSLPIGPGDCYAVITLVMEQMLKNAPFLTAETLLSLIKRTGLMASSQS